MQVQVSPKNIRLDLSDCPSILPSNLFLELQTQDKDTPALIFQLLIRRNRLTNLAAHTAAFHSIRHALRELSLRDNHLSEFPVEITQLQNLVSLSLSGNRIEVIKSGLISCLVHLQWLNISHNDLGMLPGDICCCSHLRGIDVQRNKIEYLPSTLPLLSNLQVLLIQYNSMERLPNRLPSSLRTLNASFNNITAFPIVLAEYPPDSLTHLYLSGNPLKELSSIFLDTGYENLISLDLHSCLLHNLPAKFFENLATRCPSLERLNLAINRLQVISSTIGRVKQLRWLNLNDNLLQALPPEISALTNLVKLGLVQNNLQELPPHIFCHMRQLVKIDIRRNPRLMYFPPSIISLITPRENDQLTYNALKETFPSMSCPTSLCSEPDTREALRPALIHDTGEEIRVDGILCTVTNNGTFTVQLKSMDSLKQAATENFHQNYSFFDNTFLDESSMNIIDHELPSQDVQQTVPVELTRRVRSQVQKIFYNVPSLRDISLCMLLNKVHVTRNDVDLSPNLDDALACAFHENTNAPDKIYRIDLHPHLKMALFKSVLNRSIIPPSLLQLQSLSLIKQCDYCNRWWMHTGIQLGHVVSLDNRRPPVPIRYNICSKQCLNRCIGRLFQEQQDTPEPNNQHSIISVSRPPIRPSNAISRQYSWQTFLPRLSRTLRSNDLHHYTQPWKNWNSIAFRQLFSLISSSCISRNEDPVEQRRSNTDSITDPLPGDNMACIRRSLLRRTKSFVSLSALTYTESHPSDLVLKDDDLQPFEPPSLTDPTIHIFNAQEEEPRIRQIMGPSASTVAVCHLPHDAICLEKF